MLGNGLTYDSYHLALYLCTVMAWGALALGFLLRGVGAQALYKGCAMFVVTLAISVVLLLLDILRVLEHHQVELALLLFGMLLPCALMLTLKATNTLARMNLK
ncbi:hypothetical protein [Pseudomonas putida]